MSLVVAEGPVTAPPPRAIHLVPLAVSGAPIPVELVGVSTHVVRVRAWCAAVGPLPCRVVITGETGTGKGLVARLLHRHSARGGAYVQRGAGETAATLVQDDLFGHAKGAFTDAKEARVGLLEAADRGTFFLDELQDLAPEAQRGLRGFLDGRGFTPQGANRRLHPDVRLICAAQRPLRALVSEGLLREDLMYRIRQMTITLRPLRDRPEDVGPIAESVLCGHPAASGRSDPLRLSAHALRILQRHPWPGNVRELEGAVDVAAWMAGGAECVEPEHLPEWFFEELEPEPGAGRSGELGVEAILLSTHGNVTQAAKRMGMCTRTLRRRIAASGVDLAAIRWEGSRTGGLGARRPSAGSAAKALQGPAR